VPPVLFFAEADLPVRSRYFKLLQRLVDACAEAAAFRHSVFDLYFVGSKVLIGCCACWPLIPLLPMEPVEPVLGVVVPVEPVLGVVVLGLVVVEPPLPVWAWAVATASDPAASATASMRVNMAFSPFGCSKGGRSSPDLWTIARPAERLRTAVRRR
jgi:hypothetical protein